MPTRPLPLTPAECSWRYRQRTLGRLLYVAGDMPLRLAEELVDAGVLPQQDASDRRALFAALVRAAEGYIKKIVTP